MDCPLSDDEKMPISAMHMQYLCESPSFIAGVQNICQPEDAEVLFRVGGDSYLSSRILSLIYEETPSSNGTEASFIGFWD